MHNYYINLKSYKTKYERIVLYNYSVPAIDVAALTCDFA